MTSTLGHITSVTTQDSALLATVEESLVDVARTRESFGMYFPGLDPQSLVDMTADAVGKKFWFPSNQLHLPHGYPRWCGRLLRERWYGPDKAGALEQFLKKDVYSQRDVLRVVLARYNYQSDLVAYFLSAGQRWMLPMLTFLRPQTECVAWSAAQCKLCVGRRRPAAN